MPEYRALADGCHCGGNTTRYRSREFVNAHGWPALKVFHRCEVCSSRFEDVRCATLDNAKTVSVTVLAGASATADIAVSDVSRETQNLNPLQ